MIISSLRETRFSAEGGWFLIRAFGEKQGSPPKADGSYLTKFFALAQF